MLEGIKQRFARSYTDFPKYQRLAYTLKDIGILLAETERLDAWGRGLEATALKWANESNELREKLEALSVGQQESND